MFAKFFLAAVALQALLVCADPGPIIPGPGDSYKEGGNCTIGWSADTTGQWTSMQIELKTGDNLDMVALKLITTIDATKQTQYVYPCPQVSPNSAIYFYEFTSPSSTTKYWTTRFTITNANGNSTPPPQSTQPNGDDVPWGTGTLIDDSSSGPASSSSPSLPGPSPPSPDSSSTQSGSRIVSSPTSRSSSTSAPPSTQTGGSNNSTSQNNSAGDIAVAIPKALVFAIGLVAASTAFLL